MATSTVRHITMSIDGGILPRRKRPRQLDGIFADRSTGKTLTGEELLEMAIDLKARGFEVIPVCDHHDERGRCLGHPADDDHEQGETNV